MIALTLDGTNHEITTIPELIECVQTNNCNEYYGFNNLSYPEAYIYSSKAPYFGIKIKYDDIIDCKRTESALRPHCIKFSQRLYNGIKRSSVTTSKGLKEELDNLKKPYQSYEQVIWDLVVFYYDNQ